MNKHRVGLLLITGLVILLAAGCVSSKKFETAVSDVSSRVDDVQSTVESNSEKIEKLGQKDTELEQKVGQVDSRAGQAQQASEAAMAKASEAVQAAKGKVIWQVTLTNRDVVFSVDGTEITADGARVLDDLAAKLKSMDRMVFLEIQGHTDASGGEAYNKALGLKRAEVVQHYLHDQGIPLNLMSVISYGESRPVADNSTSEGRAANRRVEILVLE